MPPENNMNSGSHTLPIAVDSRGRERERVDQARRKPLAHARSHEAGLALTGLIAAVLIGRRGLRA